MKRASICAAAVAAIAAIAWWMIPPAGVPRFDEVRLRWRPSDAQLLDRHGEPLHEARIDRHGRRLAWTALDDISPALVSVVIRSEDRRFWQHHGVDLPAIARSAGALMLSRRGAGGASTITMQLAALLDPALAPAHLRKSLWQKLVQMKAACGMERTWSKRQILEAYLNLVTYRGELQGVSAAARVMFGKQPDGISPGEAVVMAELLKAPNARKAALARRARALRNALGPEAPAPEEITDAVNRATSVRGSDFTRVALAPGLAERWLTGAHRSLRCTLDRGLQSFATRTLRSQILQVHDRHVTDGAVLVVDNASGEVWAYVAGSGDLSSAAYVDGVRAPRQPGSTLKPFLYGLALERRLLTPASLLLDTPLELPEERGLYRPLDYDRQFRGLVSMRTALASSLNIPAVRTASLLGVEALAEHLRRLGFEEIIEEGDYYGASIALGSPDVSLWNLVKAYRTLADAGVLSPLRLFSSDVTSTARIYSPATAYLVSDILADRASRSATFGLQNSLATRYWSAVKTGTSKDMRDNWCVGYTRRFTVGVWVGNFSGAAMHNVTGITGAAPVWLEVMNYLYERYGGGAVPRPEGLREQTVEFPEAVEPARPEWFIAGTEPGTALVRLNNRNPRILSPAADTIIALDPDIPRPLQRVTFEAGPATTSARWKLDARDMGSAAELVLWPPTPGVHVLALTDRSGRALDQVSFKVRGSE
ncbi:MAG TPA: penicillin-binding protein 1C [Candidatus Binataceae bacterium]|nr:penicillin-binding protein 1C [Candidatus Binataceae bacterium]